MLDPIAVSVEKMFDLVQVSETSLREGPRSVAVRYSLFAKPPQFASAARFDSSQNMS
jgi:hypothetical protein